MRCRITCPALLVAFLCIPVRGQGPPSGETFLPILANGVLDESSHYQTVFRFVETSGATASTAVSVEMDLFDNEGGLTFGETSFCPPPIPKPPGTLVFGLRGWGSLHLGTKGFIQPYEPDVGVNDGWARITWTTPGRLTVSAEILAVDELPAGCPPVICFRPSSKYRSDALIRSVEPDREFHAATVISEYRRTALSIVNPSTLLGPAHVYLELYDQAGALFRRGGTITIPPMHRISRFAWELATVPLDSGADGVAPQAPEQFYGSARIVSDIPVVVGGLQVLLPEGRLVSLDVVSLTDTVKPFPFP